MWYMLKDLKASMTQVVSKVNELELKIAADSSQLKIDYLKEDVEALKKKDTLVDSQLSKLWTKVGDRPEDARRRFNGD